MHRPLYAFGEQFSEILSTEAPRLKLVENATSAKPPLADVLQSGNRVADVRLTDQNRAHLRLWRRQSSASNKPGAAKWASEVIGEIELSGFGKPK